MKWLPIASEKASMLRASTSAGSSQNRPIRERRYAVRRVAAAPQATGHGGVAPRPVANREIDREQVAREREHARAADLGARVAALALDALEHLVGAAPLPRVEQLVEEGATG